MNFHLFFLTIFPKQILVNKGSVKKKEENDWEFSSIFETFWPILNHFWQFKSILYSLEQLEQSFTILSNFEPSYIIRTIFTTYFLFQFPPIVMIQTDCIEIILLFRSGLGLDLNANSIINKKFTPILGIFGGKTQFFGEKIFYGKKQNMARAM